MSDDLVESFNKLSVKQLQAINQMLGELADTF
jgi:hypothetical protein